MNLISKSDWMGESGIRQVITLSTGEVVGTFRWSNFPDWLAWMSILRNVPVGNMIKFEGNGEVTRCESIWADIHRLVPEVKISGVHQTHANNWGIRFFIPDRPEYNHSYAIDLPTALDGLRNNLKEMINAAHNDAS